MARSRRAIRPPIMAERKEFRHIQHAWSFLLQMMANGIRARLSRALITASGMFLGISLLAFVLTQAAIAPARMESTTHYLWLAYVSLIIATVGITNSQVMAVAVRYRETGTLKCLGALDSFVMRLFLLESGAMGLIAAFAGAMIGCGIGCLVYGTLPFGSPLVLLGQRIPLWLAMISTVLMGGLLSIVAAMGPAWRAAKMPAVMAMRVEV